jgi:hypothetical protein
MSYALVGILLAAIALFTHSVAARLALGIFVLGLFGSYLYQRHQADKVGRSRLAFALSCASAVLGMWDIVLASIHLAG